MNIFEYREMLWFIFIEIKKKFLHIRHFRNRASVVMIILVRFR